MACTRDFQKAQWSFKGTGISYLLLLLSPWFWITWLKLGFDIHHWSISYLRHMQDYWFSISPIVWVLWPGQPNWPSQTRFPRQWLKKQQCLYLFQTCPGPILRFQFSEFGLRLHIQWLLSLYYWLDYIITTVILVLLEHHSVPGGMSNPLYHSNLSPDTFV